MVVRRGVIGGDGDGLCDRSIESDFFRGGVVMDRILERLGLEGWGVG